MGLDVRVAARPEDLLDDLLAWLDAAGGDPFATHVVVVPNAGVRAWLEAAIARHAGIVAGVRFLFPAELRTRLLGLPGPADDPWRPERVAWHVLAALGGPDAPAVPWSGTPERPWSLARRVADLLDAYGTHRPDLPAAWAAGRDDGWQAELWRDLRRRIGRPTPAETLRAALDGTVPVSRSDAPGGLPDRIAVFGVSGGTVPAAALLTLVGRDREVVVLAPFVSPGLVGRAGPVATAVDVGAGIAPARDAAGVEVAHPLLAAWGAETRDDAVVLAALGAPGVTTRAPTGSSQLARLQADLAADRLSAPVDAAVRAEGRGGDGSVQVHACHGLLRQVEVLRDALLHAFAADPTLRPEDVVVVCGDLRRAAPVLGPILGAEVAGHRIPVALVDRGAILTPPVPAALDAVLAVVGGRAARDDVLALLALPPVALALDLDDDLSLLERAVEALDVRWGFDASHRRRWGYDGDVAVGTWREALDRLLLGLLVGADADRVVAGLAPAEDVRSQDAGALGRIATALDVLGRLAAEADGPRPLAAWRPVLHAVVSALLAPARTAGAAAAEQALAVAGIRGALDGLVADAKAAGDATPLDLLEVRAALADRLDRGSGGGLGPAAGAVRVASSVPLRGVPARVIAVLDVDRITVSGPAAPDDLLAAAPRLGEPDRREEPRAVLLDLIASARDRLLLLHDGQDVGTGAALPLPLAVSELLDVLPDVDGPAPLVVRHPRHLADPRNLGGDAALGRLTDGRPWTFLPAALRSAAVDRAAGPAPLRARWDAGAAGPAAATAEPLVLAPSDLRSALRRPAQAWLRHGLGLMLPRVPERPEPDLPAWVDTELARWQLVDEALGHLRAGGDPERWVATRAVRGGVPPGRLGTALLQEVATEATALLAAARPDAVDVRHRVELDVAGVRIAGAVGLRGDRVVDVSRSSQHDADVVGAWLDLLLLRAAAAAGDPVAAGVSGATVVRRGKDGGPHVRTLTLADDSVADALRTVVDLVRRVRSGPVALLPRTVWGVVASDGKRAPSENDVTGDLRSPEARLVHGHLTPDAVLALPSGPAEEGLPGPADAPAVLRVGRVLVDAVRRSMTVTAPEAMA